MFCMWAFEGYKANGKASDEFSGMKCKRLITSSGPAGTWGQIITRNMTALHLLHTLRRAYMKFL